MSTPDSTPLTALEPRLRWLLPADLYAAAWIDPSPATLSRVFEHQRTLQRALQDYLPRLIAETAKTTGAVRYDWQEGTLMFTDLAGFTPLMEANAARGRAGAETLLGLLNSYFAAMIEIVDKAGGDLLEFTGDAMLVQFPPDAKRRDTTQAVRAGLRMQRAMAHFARIETEQGVFSLGMRVGIHTGRFLSASIGTPRRMEYVLLGNDARRTKQSEGAGRVGRVNLTDDAYAYVREQFRSEVGNPGHVLIIDDFSDEQLGEYDIQPMRRRTANTLLLDRSIAGLISAIEGVVQRTEPLACYLPRVILTVLVEGASRRKIEPEFPDLTVLFVNLMGLSASVDRAAAGEEGAIIACFSRVFALINGAVEARGGVLKNATYDRTGSNILIYFGAPDAHADDPQRAAAAALAIREIVEQQPALTIGGETLRLACQIGLTRGPAFAAEIGETRGRREFNVLGDTVNTAARMMARAEENQILISEVVYAAVKGRFACQDLGHMPLKGKAAPVAIFGLV